MTWTNCMYEIVKNKMTQAEIRSKYELYAIEQQKRLGDWFKGADEL